MESDEEFAPLTAEEWVRLQEESGGAMDRADPYLDFIDFDRPELLEFQYRFSAVVWLYENSLPWMDRELAECREAWARGDFTLEDWEGETDIIAHESESVLRQAAGLHRGSLELMSIAALESMFGDLLRGGRRARGLMARFRTWAAAVRLDVQRSEELEKALLELASRRNQFAHELDGSPWEKAGRSAPDPERVEDTFRKVGRVAIDVFDALTRG